MLTQKVMEYPLHTPENCHLIYEFCAQNQSRLGTRLLHDVPPQHVHKFESPCRLNYHTLEQSKHAKIIANTIKAHPEFRDRKIPID